jgi:intracellular multiplication protein IcmN
MEVNFNIFKLPQFLTLALLLTFFCSGLTGCASSSVERSAASGVDSAYETSNHAITHAGDGSVIDKFQNSSQTTKGVLIGGTAGGFIGGVTTGTSGLLPGAATGAVLGGILGAWIDYHTNLADQLENRGVKVLVLGDQVLIIMPSAWIFKGKTAKLRPDATSTLDLVAQFINRYTTMLVKIGAYTNDTGNRQIECYISQQQSEQIVRYLWPRVNTRVLTSQGYGGANLIARNSPEWGEGANYRVEITFEKLPT